MTALVRVAVSLLLLALLLWQIELEAALTVLLDPQLELLLVFLAVMLANRWLAAYRWFVLLHGRNPAFTLGPIVRLTFVSGFVGYLMPGGIGVDIFRYLGAVRARAGRELIVTSLLVERVQALLALALLAMAGLPLLPPALPPALSYLTWAIFAALVTMILALQHRGVRRLSGRLPPVRRIETVRTSLGKLCQGLDAYRSRPGLLLRAMALALVFQLMRCVGAALGAAALGASLPFTFFLVIVPMVNLMTLAPVSIAGLGVQEVGFVYLFGLSGMPVETAFALALLLRFAEILVILPGAWLYARGGLAPET